MKTTRHTPGPWVLAGAITEHSGCIDIRGDKNRLWVASSMGNHRIDGADNPGFPSDEAAYINARLIAACPDLLAALQEISEYREDEGTADADMVLRIIELAEKAIAKAKGD